MPISDEQITRLIYRSCLRLDAEDFDAYLELFAPEFAYRISNYSVEMRKDQNWLDVNQDEYRALLANVPLHSKPLGTFARHANVYDIERNGETRAKVTTFLTVYYTTPEGGHERVRGGQVFRRDRYHRRAIIDRRSGGTPGHPGGRHRQHPADVGNSAIS